MRKIFVPASLLGLLLFSPAHAATVTAYYQPTPYPKYKYDGSAMPQDIEKIHVWDGWVNSYYPSIQTLQLDEVLKVGGWGDIYRTYLRFDVVGLPKSVSQAALYLWPHSSSLSMTAVDYYKVTGSWTPSLNWNSQPAASLIGNRPAPVNGQWWGASITAQYNAWRVSTTNSSNWGVRLDPVNTNNNWSNFYSSRTASDGARPLLALTFDQPSGMPNFKLPLPGGASWLVTNEVGGYECTGQAPWPDVAHQGNSYFSIDFSPKNKKDSGGSYVGDIPVLAAANGKVAYVETNQYVPNGYHIVLNHSGSTSTSSGYTTKYLHLKDRPRRQDGTLLAVGNNILQGDQVGIMGTTGQLSNGTPTSTGIHLHFGAYYNGSGASTMSQLTYIVMDSWLLKSFQTECELNGSGIPTIWKRYYRSSNRAY